jgi:DNA damage-binding protein 1
MYVRELQIEGEISALSLTPHLTSTEHANVLLVGRFNPYIITVHPIKKLSQVVAASIPVSHVPRSLLISTFGEEPKVPINPRIFAGLGDGTVVICELDNTGSVLDKRAVDLGSREVRLNHLMKGSESGVIACGERCGVFWKEGEGNGRVKLSRLGLKGIKASCPFSSVANGGYRECLVFAGLSGLIAGRVRDVQKLHIRSVCPIVFHSIIFGSTKH